MSFKKLSNGAIISYNNGVTIRVELDGRKLHLKEYLHGNRYAETEFHLNEEQAKRLKEAFSKANNANDIAAALQQVLMVNPV